MPTLSRAQAILKTMNIRTKKLKNLKRTFTTDGQLDGLHLALTDYCGRIFQLLLSSATCLDCETKSLFMPFRQAQFAGKHFHLKLTFF